MACRNRQYPLGPNDLSQKWLSIVWAFFVLNLHSPSRGERETTMGEEGHEPSLSERIMSFAAGDTQSQFILKEDATGEPDAAASEDLAAGADQQGNQGDTDAATDGLDTTSDEEDPDADQGEDDDEGADETDQKDEEGKGPKKKTFEERMQEIEAKVEAKLRAELEAKFQQQQKPQEPDFYEVDTAKVNAWLKDQNEKIQEAELDDDHLLAEKLKREKVKMLDDLDANEQKRAAWEKEQTAKQAGSTENDRVLDSLDKAAEFFRAEKKIEPAVWLKMGDFFAAECQKDPLLGRKFAEKAKLLGPIEAVEWAHTYTLSHMGKEAKQAAEKKEQTKTRTAAVSAAQTATAAPVDLAAVKKAFDSDPSEENFARFMEAKRKHKAA